MLYCTKCLYPDTKPDLTFDEKGVCSACKAFEDRAKIDWNDRANQFAKLIERIKSVKAEYDCIIPVSGGKDSHYQVIKALEYGLKPLAVTATTDDLSSIGRRNLNNISKLGVDHIEISTNSKVRRKINAYTLREIGDISWAEHVTIFTIPNREAIERRIPLVIWGENPQNEYGGPDTESQHTFNLSNNWLNEFGGLNGMRVSDVEDRLQVWLTQYKPMNLNHGEGVFLGQFFPWDGKKNAEIAQKNGFETYALQVEGCGVDYENLDNHQTGIHDYFKYLKFGFGRATDIACNNIRRGLISREEAKEFVWEFDGRYPRTYLGKAIEDILDPLNMSVVEFMHICDRFTNKQLFMPRSPLKNRPMLKLDIMEV